MPRHNNCKRRRHSPRGLNTKPVIIKATGAKLKPIVSSCAIDLFARVYTHRFAFHSAIYVWIWPRVFVCALSCNTAGELVCSRPNIVVWIKHTKGCTTCWLPGRNRGPKFAEISKQEGEGDCWRASAADGRFLNRKFRQLINLDRLCNCISQ